MAGSERMTARQFDQLHEGSQLQFVQDPGFVGADGFRTQVHAVSDGVVRLSFYQQP
ncbi:hypothetical protein D3C84_1226670 [compost metagenome]